LHAEFKYDPFVSQQIQYIDRLGSVDISKDEITSILRDQKKSYSDGLEEIMSHKQAYIDRSGVYENKIFALEKIININRKAQNKYAVLRDEIQVKSFQILANQHKMMKGILGALDDEDSVGFSKALNTFIVKNIADNKPLIETNYDDILKIKSTSNALVSAKENIKDFYAIIDINTDVLNYLRISEYKMYKLNKYSKYNLIAVVLWVNNSKLADTFDPILEPFGLDVIKLMLITSLILIIYIIKKLTYILIERKIAKEDSKEHYAQGILIAIRISIEQIILVVNINLIIYILSDFHTAEYLIKFFNMLYSAIFVIIVYKAFNIFAKIKLAGLEENNNKVKNDVINVGMKILNFIVFLIGFMLILHFAGVNLTAILSGLGIGGLAVALAAKDSLANFFGTLSILFSDVLSQGDWIEVHGEEGVVVEIGTRVTTLRTFDNALVSIPNAILASEDVKNWNRRSLGRRIKMNLKIKYDSKSEDIKKAVYDIREMLETHNAIATEHTQHEYMQRTTARLVSKDDEQGIKKTLLVYLDEFSDSSINILVYCFTKSVDWEDWLATKENIMHKIMAIFEKNNLEFAFPSLSIYNEQK
jgi:MscS family membrane protein